MISLSKDIKHWRRLWSVWISVVVTLVSGIEIAAQLGLGIAPLWREIISVETYPKIVATLSTLNIVARFIKQSYLHVEETNHVSETDSPAS